MRRRGLERLAARVFEEQPLAVVDVGSEGGLFWELEPLAPWIDAVGFDPDEEACRTDTARAAAMGLRQRFLPHAVAGTDGQRVFNLCRKPASSSLLEPNPELHARFPEPERMDVVRAVEIQTRALGPLLEELDVRVEFLKLDVHGIEPEVLQSLSPAQWGSLLAVHVELLIGDQYRGQAAWGDVHSMLAGHGLELYDLKRFSARRAGFDTSTHWTRGQLVAAEALYLRRGEELDTEARRRLAVVAAFFGHNDVAVAELEAGGDPEGAATVRALSRRGGPLARRLATRMIRAGESGWRLYGPMAGPWATDHRPDRL